MTTTPFRSGTPTRATVTPIVCKAPAGGSASAGGVSTINNRSPANSPPAGIFLAATARGTSTSPGPGGPAVLTWPGASSDPILVRSATGYTLEQPRSELFTHRDFKDFTAKIFAKREGKIVPLGEFTIEHRIIPHADEPPAHP